uniref:C2H2-type domain-containing protein n=1 Tax=Plectus sambesii TaxID=2011161 RepID=A0A914WNT9_9BILA
MVGIVGLADEKQRLRFDEFSESYALFVGRASKKIDKVGLLAIYSKVVCNRFALKDGNQNIIGVGLYPNLCRIGHSCRPTGAVVFHERTAIVVPTRSKSFPSPLDWSLISRCYPDVDPISTIETRKDKLKSEYFIDCHCELCEDAAANETMEAFACSKRSCLGRVAIVDGAFVCGKCGKEFDEKARNQAHQSLQRIDSLFDPEYSQRSLKDQLHCILDCVHFTQTILHKYNIKRLTVLKAAYDGCVLEKRHKEAINFGRQSLEIYRYYLDEFDPFLAAFTLNLATTCMHAGELDAASQLMHSIIDRCEHIYGKQSEALNYIDPSFEEILAKLSLGDMGL